MRQPDTSTLPNSLANEAPSEPSQKPVYGGRYAVEEQLGRGGMGRVFRARDLKIGRMVALKVLGPGAQRKRFEQEARATGALNHPHIAAVYDVGEHGGEPYIVSELLEGETLRAALANGPLAPAEALKMARHLAEGTAAAHRKGIVHRDLKPENLFLANNGDLKILDFGIAKLPPEAVGSACSTETGAIIGTPAYMSPEQVRGEPAGARSDVFACGAVIHEMLSGKPLFARASSVDSAYAVLHDVPALAPGPLAAIVTKCLAKDPAARYPSAAELLEDLNAVTRGGRSVAGPRMRRRAAMIAAGVVASTLVLITVAVTNGRSVRPQATPRSKESLAVLPFVVRGTGQSNYLGEGMVDLLSTTLASGSMRMVDAHALLAMMMREGWAPTPEHGRAVASRFGVRQYLLGTVVEVGSRLRIHASVYDADSDAGPVRDATVEGESAKIFELIDDLSAQIQTGTDVGRRRLGERLVHLAQVTTSSPSALTAYLEGAQARRRGQRDEAIVAFQRAIVADPAFALAHFSIAYLIGLYQFGDRQLAKSSLASALRLRAALPAQDQMRLDALNAFAFEYRYTEAEHGCREILRAHPDDVDTWYLLGEVLTHGGHWSGRPIGEAKEALEQVLALDPANGEPFNHLLQFAFVSGDRDELLRLLDRFLKLEFAQNDDFALPWRWIRALLRNDREERSQILKRLRNASSATQWSAFWATLRLPGRVADAGELASFAPTSWLPVLHQIVTGRIRRARRSFEDTFGGKSGEERAVEVARWWGTLNFYRLDPAKFRADRNAVEQWRPPDAQSQYFRASWLGRISASLGDSDGAEHAISDLQRLQVGPARVAGAAHWIRAIAAWRTGRPAEALAAVDAIQADGITGSPLRPIENIYQDIEYLRAELLFSFGHHDEAAQWFLAFNSPALADVVIAPRARRLAQIEEKRGNAQKAITYYEHFIELWSDCDPELRPQVEEARARVAALRR